MTFRTLLSIPGIYALTTTSSGVSVTSISRHQRPSRSLVKNESKRLSILRRNSVRSLNGSHFIRSMRPPPFCSDAKSFSLCFRDHLLVYESSLYVTIIGSLSGVNLLELEVSCITKTCPYEFRGLKQRVLGLYQSRPLCDLADRYMHERSALHPDHIAELTLFYQ